MKNLLFTLLLLIVGLASIHSQKERSIYKDQYSENNSEVVHEFRIGITPSALINRWMGYQGKLSYAHKKLEYVANIGFLNGSDQGDHYSGFRFRPTVKYHFVRNNTGSFYFGMGALWRQLNVSTSGTFRLPDNSFVQQHSFTVDERMRGIFTMFGTLIPFRNERFMVDIGFGIGNSRIKTEHRFAPSGATYVSQEDLFITDFRVPGNRNYLILFGHFSFLVRI